MAQTLDIDHSTFLEHVRKVQRKILSTALSCDRTEPEFPGYTEF
ncbi:hypothetical protein [Haladaptatus sp. CMAA 1911]